MAVPVIIPKVGNTVESCLLGAWKKQAGDSVAKGEVLLEIETDKAVFEVEAPAAGTLLVLFFKEGELVPVLTNVAVIGEKGEAYEQFRPSTVFPLAGEKAGGEAPVPAVAPESSIQEAVALTEKIPPVDNNAESGRLSPRARKFVQRHHLQPGDLKGSGPGGRILERDVVQTFYARPRSSLLAGKLLGQGWSYRGTYSGLNGMITGADLRPPGKKLSALRTAIAGRMRSSLATTAQYTVALSAGAVHLLDIRRKIKAGAAEPGYQDITIGDMVMYALLCTLEIFPEFNAELLNGYVYQYRDIHLGFACDTPRGLLVPVVKQAGRLQLPELSAAVKRLALKAGKGLLTPGELSGGTFTVTNLGPAGIEYFTPVLNAPQVAILGVGSINLKPVRTGGTVQFFEHITLCLTVDHQVIDGTAAARFLGALKKQIEDFDDVNVTPGKPAVTKNV